MSEIFIKRISAHGAFMSIARRVGDTRGLEPHAAQATGITAAAGRAVDGGVVTAVSQAVVDAEREA